MENLLQISQFRLGPIKAERNIDKRGAECELNIWAISKNGKEEIPVMNQDVI